ncbi:MAG: hypothetical protein ACRYGK_17580, partial [Janthinobacterium lividum]
VGEHALEIVLEQGKYHQVKRMLVAAGNHCSALQRTAIGGLSLQALGLELGEWCVLDAGQIALLASAGEQSGSAASGRGKDKAGGQSGTEAGSEAGGAHGAEPASHAVSVAGQADAGIAASSRTKT